MTPADIDAAMQRAIAAVGRPCHHSLVPAHLLRAREDGWLYIGTVTIPDQWKAWQVWVHDGTGRGVLWGMRWTEAGAQPRRFVAGA